MASLDIDVHIYIVTHPSNHFLCLVTVHIDLMYARCKLWCVRGMCGVNFDVCAVCAVWSLMCVRYVRCGLWCVCGICGVNFDVCAVCACERGCVCGMCGVNFDVCAVCAVWTLMCVRYVRCELWCVCGVDFDVHVVCYRISTCSCMKRCSHF
jgi:hypothetical protein